MNVCKSLIMSTFLSSIFSLFERKELSVLNMAGLVSKVRYTLKKFRQICLNSVQAVAASGETRPNCCSRIIFLT